MWLQKSGSSLQGGDRMQRKGTGTAMVAVAIDKDKYSQQALKWSIEHLLTRGQTVVLIHVIRKTPPTGGGIDASAANKQQTEKQTRDLFLTFHCFCTRKEIQCYDVILEDANIAKALTEYASYAAIEYLVLGASSRHGFIRFRSSDVPSQVMKSIPDFCTVYVISKGKISSAKKSSRTVPFPSPIREKIEEQSNTNFEASVRRKNSFNIKKPEIAPEKPLLPAPEDPESIRSPFNKGRGLNAKLLCGELSEPDTDISFVSSGRPSCDRMSNANAMLYDLSGADLTPRMSTASERSFESPFCGTTGADMGSMFSSSSITSARTDEVDNEMRRLKMELQRTMEMYSSACKDALTAKQKAGELERSRVEEANRLSEASGAQGELQEVADKEKERYQALMAKARASRRIAEIESQKEALEHPEEKQQDLKSMEQNQFRYRRYTIDEIEKATELFTESRKIGEGGYGPVFKGTLDNQLVAIKVLRPDAAQGRSQFQQEVEVLSCMRHPNMVLLLGACPEYCCLVYEYMANGSLEDRLLRRGNTPPLPWQVRFKIAAEIATGILFLHQTKPEPIVHRDLKPGNILLDRNFMSKISDVGLARLLPASVTEDVTQYRMTSAAGTMCYIDPEYQQTGMLGVKSDVYSLGIMLLQLITARPAMGLAHHVRRSIDKGTFDKMLDPTVRDWPVDEALGFAKLSIQCAELRRKDRPDLGKVVLPELNRLRDFGEEYMTSSMATNRISPSNSESDLATDTSNPD
uniref:U-box domain-containing protein 35-like n=1 Tax=Erigeron canadensis TaxID=72917 RepID=UPI001CB9BDEE|nr:U-box domain-containing protein 35-like [Erigeron canadensis]